MNALVAVENPHRHHGLAKDGRPPSLIQLHFRGKTKEIRLDLSNRDRMVEVRRNPPMPNESGKPLIVISYAHADEPESPAGGEVKWLSFVTGYLKPAIKHGAVDLWIDRLMPGGAGWEREIEQKLRACDIFILLVSRHSLSSDYVVDKEIAIVRERQAKGEAVHFYPLVLTPTPKIALDLVRDKNLRPRDGKPFSDYSPHERYRHMNEAADEIAEIAAGIAQREAKAPSPPPTSQSRRSSPVGKRPRGVSRIKDRGTLEVWLQGQSREVAVAIAARAALRVAPLAVVWPEERVSLKPLPTADLTGRFFRASAVAWFAAQHPTRGNELRAAARAAIAGPAAANTAFAADAAVAAVAAATAVFSLASAAAAARAVADAADAIAGFAAAAAKSAADADNVWEEVRADAAAIIRAGAGAVAETPLWTSSRPEWARTAWDALRATLPKGESWDVWIDWYEERLRGGSRSEDYELVFASVPQGEWEKGPAAANAWIKAKLQSTEAGDPSVQIDFHDRRSFEKWLEGQEPNVPVLLATRAALRVLPASIQIGDVRRGWEEKIPSQLRGEAFRAIALARVSAMWPSNDPALQIALDSAVTPAVSHALSPAGVAADAADAARLRVTRSAARASAARAAENAALILASEAGPTASWAIWEETRFDARLVQTLGAAGLSNCSTWSAGRDQMWASDAWASLIATLPREEAWDVGSTGTISACAAARAVGSTSSFSRACRRRNGTRGRRRRTRGSRRICRTCRRTRWRPIFQSLSQTSSRPGPMLCRRKGRSLSRPERRAFRTTRTSIARRNTARR
jgi:TIR domain